MPTTKDREKRQSIIDACLRMNVLGINQGTSGNISLRHGDGMLITPTSLPYDRMRSEDIVAIDFAANYEGNHRPSSEWRFHRDILRARDDVNVVLHTHSTFSTILAVHERGIPCFHYMVAVAGGNDVRFSNRPFGVKHFQTIHQCDVDVARGLVLLFGIGTGAFPSWDSRTRRNNLLVGLAVEERRVQADIRTHLIHRPARDIFPPLGGALVFSYRVHAAAVACSLVQQNSVPSTHMRCMITASRRAKATIAFFIPRRLAICMAHALSQDHFFECIML